MPRQSTVRDDSRCDTLVRRLKLVDWNNNYGNDPHKCVFCHCGNWAKTYLPDIEISTAPILGSALGEENTYGALAGRTPGGGPVTFARVSTDDRHGKIVSYVGEGRFTGDPLETFGTKAVVEVPGLIYQSTHPVQANSPPRLGCRHRLPRVAFTIAVHAFALQPFQDTADQGARAARQSQAAGERALHELQIRRRGLLAATILIIGFLVTLWFKIRTMHLA